MENHHQQQQQRMAALEELPVDAWLVVSGYLSDADLVHLLHVSRWSRQLFSLDVYWCDRLMLDDASEGGNRANACQLYLGAASSFKFDGLPIDPHAPRRPSAVARIDDADNVIIHLHNPLSFDLWFCLLDGGGNKEDGDDERHAVYSGGILLGTQSAGERRRPWRYNHQLAYVDSDKTLYCSVVNKKPAIASSLELHRWYHLALTYANQTQRVYLDGQLKSTLEGRSHEGWYLLKYLQVGTGLLFSREQRLPVLDYCGWYPFNGLIDNLRIWSQDLSSEGVQSLTLGSARSVQGRPVYELKRDLDCAIPPPAPQRHPTRVGCTRPNKKVVELFRLGKCTPHTSEQAPPAHQHNRFFRSVRRAFKRFTTHNS